MRQRHGAYGLRITRWIALFPASGNLWDQQNADAVPRAAIGFDRQSLLFGSGFCVGTDIETGRNGELS
ncbi:hypothetical protein E1218_30580 [Kribbella turkmenica]|uniref:Uncharacterized protein n=1 Tax=Kribbella turkmenica TaxID=2530375 RepID=A0A4V2YDM5_9ACTN|nr:hypothetical protein [Kribbella turkmenica]TDD15976.1 hypothetical protein E1218_30580 [Kribbella turkmenica]